MNILVCTPGRLLQHMDESPGFDAGQLQVSGAGRRGGEWNERSGRLAAVGVLPLPVPL